MALYEYLCRDCQTSFEVRRPMGDVDGGVACPSGHTDVRRKLSTFVSVRRAGYHGSQRRRCRWLHRRVLRGGLRLWPLTGLGFDHTEFPASWVLSNALALVRGVDFIAMPGALCPPGSDGR